MLGTGITLWWSADPATAKVVIDDTNDGNLIQYNFISTADTGAMPGLGLVEMAAELNIDISWASDILDTLKGWGIYAGIDLGAIFNKFIVTESYSSAVFNDNSLNAGIVYLDKTTTATGGYNADSDRMGLYDYLFDPEVEQSGFLNTGLRTLTKYILKALNGEETLPVVLNTYLNNVDANKDMHKDSADASTTYYFDNYEFENGQIIH